MLKTNRNLMLESSFILLLIYIAAWFSKAISYSSSDAKIVRKRVLILLSCVVLYSAYTLLIGYTEIIQDTSLPPKMPLFLIFPIFSIFVWFFISKRADPYLDAVPLYFAPLFQHFRIFVELLIFGCYVTGLTRGVEATFEGYNYEIYFACTGLIVGFLIWKKKMAPKIIIVWNFVGIGFLTVIVGIFITLFLKPEIWGYAGSVVSKEFMYFPYMLIPSIYMPVAVFTHVFSIVQHRRLLKGETI